MMRTTLFPVLAISLLASGCARMQERAEERREARAIRQIERRMEIYRDVVRKLPDDPELGVPILEPYYEPNKLTRHLLHRDYKIIRGVSQDMVASSIYKLKLNATGDFGVATIRFVRKYPDGREQFGSFDSEWKRVRGKWLLALDNFWSDSSQNADGTMTGFIHSTIFPRFGLENLPYDGPPNPVRHTREGSASLADRRFESYPIMDFGQEEWSGIKWLPTIQGLDLRDGVVRSLSTEGVSPNIAREVLVRYGIKIFYKVVNSSDQGGNSPNQVTVSRGAYSNPGGKRIFGVFDFGQAAVSRMTELESDEMKLRGIDPSCSNASEVEYGIIETTHGYDLGIKSMKVIPKAMKEGKK